MTTNPSSSRGHRQRPRTGKSSAARRAAITVSIVFFFLLLLLAISVITAESASAVITENDNILPNDDDEPSSSPESIRNTAAAENIASDNNNNRETQEEETTKINSPTPDKVNNNNNSNNNNKSNNQPTATPPNKHHTTSSSRTIIQSFQTLFAPQMEEYTLTKFDPYSFSGAPLGGWGRATRSRLASLPIRLVSDYGGGLNLLEWKRSGMDEDDGFKRGCDEFGRYIVVVNDDNDTSEEEVCVLNKEGLKQMETVQEHLTEWGLTEDTLNEVWAGATKVPNNNNNINNEDETIGVMGYHQILDQFDALYTNGGKVEDPRKSIGPHFTIRDGMGRQFVCRVYDEGELEVESYMNSMFSPAVRLGYSNNVNDVEGGDAAKEDGKGGVKKDSKEEEEDDDVMDVATPIVLETTVIADGSVDGYVADALTSQIRNLLEDLELNNQFDAENIVIDVEGVGVDNDEISDIVKAAIQGAGGVNNKKKETSSSPYDAKPLATELTADEIFDALKKLRGLCSQLHLGWWSYEWCHDRQVRQFHVDVSPDPTAADGRKYEIVDITVIGHYHDGVTEIINPLGRYNGEVKRGSTRTYIPVGDGDEMKLESTSPHSHRDDSAYSKPFYDREKDMKTIMSNRLMNEMREYKFAQIRQIGHSTEIVKQQFSHGDMCDEVGMEREVSVEYRCCTEKEISHWLKSKRGQTDAKKGEDPLAVLVSVQENETCVYRAKICTPVLCPEALLQAEVAPSPTSPGKPATTHDTNKVGTVLGKKEAIDTVHRALESAYRALHNEGGATQVKVIIGGEETAEWMNELIQAAQNGEAYSNSNAFKKVIDAMGMGKRKIEDSKLAERMEGKSIREVLGSTLDGRPCLAKNLGWWTYEYCHGKDIKQYHVNNLIDPNTGAQKVRVDSNHILGKYTDDLKYPDEDEHLHVVNVTGLSADMDIGRRNKRGALNIGGNGGNQNEKGPGGNGAVFVQEYLHGDSCDHEDVAESVIKGGNIVHGSIERSTTVRFSCGKSLELVDIKEDSTCHYIIDVAVPALCNHPLFMAPITKTQVVKCLPV